MMFNAVSGQELTLVYVVVIMALIYFMMIRPQKKQMNARKEMLNSLNVGAHISTVGGLNGYIRAIKGELIYLEIADGLIVEMMKASVAGPIDESIYDEHVDASEENEEDEEPVIDVKEYVDSTEDKKDEESK